MPLVYYVPEYERDASQISLNAERLLRLLGASDGFPLCGLHGGASSGSAGEYDSYYQAPLCTNGGAFSDHAQLRRAQSPHAYSELLELS